MVILLSFLAETGLLEGLSRGPLQPNDRQKTPLSKQLPRRDLRALGHRLKLRPRDFWIDHGIAGHRGEAAIRARDHILAPDHPGDIADTLGDQLGMFDEVVD